jgi:hypothetical protein
MPPRGVTKGSKRERQYEHIKDSKRQQGASLKRAEEIAARTVNKERARGGESKPARPRPPATSPPAGAAGFAPANPDHAGAPVNSSTKRLAASASKVVHT